MFITVDPCYSVIFYCVISVCKMKVTSVICGKLKAGVEGGGGRGRSFGRSRSVVVCYDRVEIRV